MQNNSTMLPLYHYDKMYNAWLSALPFSALRKNSIFPTHLLLTRKEENNPKRGSDPGNNLLQWRANIKEAQE
jgi:hypothetical protein